LKTHTYLLHLPCALCENKTPVTSQQPGFHGYDTALFPSNIRAMSQRRHFHWLEWLQQSLLDASHRCK